MKNFEAICTALVAVAATHPAGFTYNIETGKLQTSGVAVARKETQNSFGAEGLENVVRFALANRVPCVGGWLDRSTGLYYFDATEICDTREEAIQRGRENAQIAVFDISECEEIRIK